MNRFVSYFTVTYIFFIVGMSFVACGESIEGTAFATNLDSRVYAISQTTCDRFVECNLIGTDKGDVYVSRDACVAEMERYFDSLWDSECARDQVNAFQYTYCYERAETSSCEQHIFDVISYRHECSGEMICVNGSMDNDVNE